MTKLTVPTARAAVTPMPAMRALVHLGFGGESSAGSRCSRYVVCDADVIEIKDVRGPIQLRLRRASRSFPPRSRQEMSVVAQTLFKSVFDPATTECPVVIVYRVRIQNLKHGQRLSFVRLRHSVHRCRELRIPATYVLPIKCDLSVWWSAEYATKNGLLEHVAHMF